MRIAIVSQFTSPGGGARFLRGLCLGLLNRDDVTEIGLFVVADDAGRDGLVSLLPSSDKLSVHLLTPTGDLMDEGVPAPQAAVHRLKAWGRSHPAIARAYRAVRYGNRQDADGTPIPRIELSERMLARIGAYDVAYFPWPRQVTPPSVPPALVGTFHDFNHRHRFGNFRPQDIEVLDAEMVEWLSGRVQPICSTRFIASELDTYYPHRTNAPEVIYLSTFAIHDPSDTQVEAVIGELGLPADFALCPTNVSPHKNLLSLLRALGAMKRAGNPLKLVVTGSGTQCLGVPANQRPPIASVYKRSVDELNATLAEEDLVPGRDVWLLGYVSDAQMDALVRAAALVVAPSRYEAGSGPALDAWWLGTPVVSSSLEPVVEQMQFLGTEALLFEPNDVDGLARTLTEAIADPDAMAGMACRSQEAIKRYTWDDVAREYARVFRKAIDSHPAARRI